ncbi:hypothetical protein TNCV_400991 [Trichonephila clavipes]|nr:hypothetical protein TNCV_400991 [Trichonephila clavipes]
MVGMEVHISEGYGEEQFYQLEPTIVMQKIPCLHSTRIEEERDSQVVKVSDSGWSVTNSSPIPLKSSRVGDDAR